MTLSTAEIRAELLTLTNASAAEIRQIFRSMLGSSAEDIRDRLIEDLLVIGDEYQLSAASLAADWYDDLREAHGASKAFTAITAELATPARWEKLAGWGTGPLFQAEPDLLSAQTLVEGGMQRTIADAHRNTITTSSIQDPSARGWRRAGVGANCPFCSELLAMDRVYSEAGASAEAHDHCNCVAEPVFD